MERLRKLFQEINGLTLKIEQEYPELYEFLNETIMSIPLTNSMNMLMIASLPIKNKLYSNENPITIPNSEHPQIDTENLADYLDSLNQLLKHDLMHHQQQNSI